MLAACYLYALGMRATIKKWKQRAHTWKKTSKNNADADKTDEEDNTELHSSDKADNTETHSRAHTPTSRNNNIESKDDDNVDI